MGEEETFVKKKDDFIRKRSNKKLKNEYEALLQTIEIGGYRTKDIIYRNLLEAEISDRNLKIKTIVEV